MNKKTKEQYIKNMTASIEKLIAIFKASGDAAKAASEKIRKATDG